MTTMAKMQQAGVWHNYWRGNGGRVEMVWWYPTGTKTICSHYQCSKRSIGVVTIVDMSTTIDAMPWRCMRSATFHDSKLMPYVGIQWRQERASLQLFVVSSDGLGQLWMWQVYNKHQLEWTIE
jgi:hypothetical protein